MERRPYKKVKIVALNKFHDLALLRIEDDSKPKAKFKPILTFLYGRRSKGPPLSWW